MRIKPLSLLVAALCIACVSATPRPPRPPNPYPVKRVTPVQQGAGALQLIAKAVIVPINLWTDQLAWSYSSSAIATITNYNLYSGPKPGEYTKHIPTGPILTTSFVSPIANDDYAATNYLAVTALDNQGLESDYGNEIRIPELPLTNFFLTLTTTGTNIQMRTSLKGAWTSLRTNAPTPFTNPVAPLYFRSQGRGSNRVFITQTRY